MQFGIPGRDSLRYAERPFYARGELGWIVESGWNWFHESGDHSLCGELGSWGLKEAEAIAIVKKNKYHEGGMKMRRLYTLFMVVVAMAVLLGSGTPQAAGTTASTTKKAAASSAAAEQPQPGGTYKVILRAVTNLFGYPPRMAGTARDSAPPFFDRLLRIGDDGKYKPELALSWDTSADGKTITFKLRQGVRFHDGTPFNGQAVKANLDNLIPPKATILSGITSVDVVDDYTVRLNLSSYNNLILHHFAANPATYLYSPEALAKNGADWANTHPVGTGPFMLKAYQPNISLTLVKNPNYWQKGLPYLDAIEIAQVADPMTQLMTFKAGQAHAIYDAQTSGAVQLRDEGYPVQLASGSFIAINFDTKNSKIFSNPKVRQAIEYAIDKEAICDGPGQGLYTPVYQILPGTSPDYNQACPPRRYDPAKAKKLLAEAGYPNGFSFKMFILDSVWRDGWVAIQNYLDAVGIKMDVNYVSVSVYNLMRAGGKIEPGGAGYHSYPTSSNTLFMLDSFWRSNSAIWQYVVRPAGIDKLIDQAKLSRDPAAITKINRQALKLLYDDATVVPVWVNPRIAVVGKAVQKAGWFVYGDPDNNEMGRKTWLKK
jgi:peptide/nickel transport system substrate-binding protein